MSVRSKICFFSFNVLKATLFSCDQMSNFPIVISHIPIEICRNSWWFPMVPGLGNTVQFLRLILFMSQRVQPSSKKTATLVILSVWLSDSKYQSWLVFHLIFPGQSSEILHCHHTVLLLKVKCIMSKFEKFRMSLNQNYFWSTSFSVNLIVSSDIAPLIRHSLRSISVA